MRRGRRPAPRHISTPRTPDEQLLESAQKRVTQGELADEQRRAAMARLYEGGMTQRELAERMTRASLAAGGEPITTNTVYKMLQRLRISEQEVG